MMDDKRLEEIERDYRGTKDIDDLIEALKECRKKQKWLDEVGRAQHPDDERPWIPAYLDTKAELEECKNNHEWYLKKNRKQQEGWYADGFNKGERDTKERCIRKTRHKLFQQPTLISYGGVKNSPQGQEYDVIDVPRMELIEIVKQAIGEA